MLATLSGIVLPYGQVGQRAGRKLRFIPGSIILANEIPVLIEHLQSARLGVIRPESIMTTGERVMVSATFKAQKRLRLAILGVASNGWSVGLSPGIDFLEVRDSDGILTVMSARLIELSLTASPTFPDSRAIINLQN